MDGKPRVVEREESDEALVARLAGGDPDALGDLYERHGPFVRAALAGLAPDIDPAEREELLQEIFLAVFGSAASFRREARFSTWLYAIAIRKVRHLRRGKRTRGRLRERHGAACAGVSRQGSVSPERSVAARESALAALTRLSPEQREVVWLHAVEEMSGAEIGRVLGISPRTVWTRFHRARRRLSRELAEESLEEENRRGKA